MSPKPIGAVFKILSILLLLGLIGLPGRLEASITSLTETEFMDLAPQGQLFSDTLEDYSTGQYDQSLALSNAQFTVDSGAVVIEDIVRGGQVTNVLSGTSITAGRAFSLLPDSTVAWAADLSMQAVGLGPQTFEVTVIGHSGTATFLFEKNDFNPYFASFYDPTGLISVEFHNLGFTIDNGIQFSDYDFDDIMTLSRVPLPSTVWMFVPGLLPMLVLYSFRRRIRPYALKSNGNT